MATATANAFATNRRAITIAPALAIAAFASIGAGAIHAAAIGAHSEHRQVVITFTIVAAIQIGWGVLALLYPGRLVTLLGVSANAVFFEAGCSQTSGIRIHRRSRSGGEGQLADFVAAAFAVAVMGAVVSLLVRSRPTNLGQIRARRQRGGHRVDQCPRWSRPAATRMRVGTTTAILRAAGHTRPDPAVTLAVAGGWRAQPRGPRSLPPSPTTRTSRSTWVAPGCRCSSKAPRTSSPSPSCAYRSCGSKVAGSGGLPLHRRRDHR
jgi:hypothetical protein